MIDQSLAMAPGQGHWGNCNSTGALGHWGNSNRTVLQQQLQWQLQWQWRSYFDRVATATGQRRRRSMDRNYNGTGAGALGHWGNSNCNCNGNGNGATIDRILSLYVVLQRKTSTIVVVKNVQNVWMTNIPDVLCWIKTGPF
jgi:hypothetical protein